MSLNLISCYHVIVQCIYQIFIILLGLTDHTIPRRLGPKRVGKIRRLYNLSKDDDVRQYVIRRPLPVKDGKKQQYKVVVNTCTES